MKSIILSCLISIWFLPSPRAQGLEFPSGEAEWTFVETYPPEDVFFPDRKQKFLGDSIYQGISYNILSEQGDIDKMAGLIRSDGAQVYYIPKDSIHEELWYDFDVTVGDTFYTPSFFVNNGFIDNLMIVEQIDIVETADGIERKMMLIGGVEWLEGVGALRGSIDKYEYIASSAQHYLYCFKDYSQDIIADTVTDPINGDRWDCNGFVTLTIDMDKEYIEISPNPFISQLTIQNLGLLESSSISMVDINGKDYELSISGNQIIPSDDLPSGVYFLLIQDHEQVHSQMVIKAE